MSISLGYQIPNFTYPDTTPDQLFDRVIAQAQAAERGGFDTVLLMDHFYQLPGLGVPEAEMLECYTALGALAAATSTIRLSSLVTGNTYRNPAMLAKTVTTLDVISKGRAILGIGAGWYELEHDSYGYEFGTFTDRFERLEEALSIIKPMLGGDHPTVSGKWYHTDRAMNNPRVRDTLPIMLGGSGEKKTFRLAALYADHMNIICGRDEIPTKLAALRQRCDEVGRDPATLPTSYLAFVIMAETSDEAKALQRGLFAREGVDLDAMPAEQRAAATARQFTGSPDEVAAELKEHVLDPGIDGLAINMVVNGHDPAIVELAGRALAPLVA